MNRTDWIVLDQNNVQPIFFSTKFVNDISCNVFAGYYLHTLQY